MTDCDWYERENISKSPKTALKCKKKNSQNVKYSNSNVRSLCRGTNFERTLLFLKNLIQEIRKCYKIPRH